MNPPSPRPEREFLHDLSSPLSAALLLSESLKEFGKAMDEVRIQKSLTLLHSELNRMKLLIQDRRRELPSTGSA